MQYAASTASDQTVKLALEGFANSYELFKYQVANQECVDVSGRRYASTSTEEAPRWNEVRCSLSKQVYAVGPQQRRNRWQGNTENL